MNKVATMDLALFFDGLEEIGKVMFKDDPEGFGKIVELVLGKIDAIKPKAKSEIKAASVA